MKLAMKLAEINAVEIAKDVVIHFALMGVIFLVVEIAVVVAVVIATLLAV